MKPSPKELKVLFDRKVALFRELKEYVRHVSGDNSREILSIVQNIIEVNKELLSYQAPTEMVFRGKEYFDEMVGILQKEQYFLENYFRRSLQEAIREGIFQQYWYSSLPHYQKLLDILRLDLTYFSLVLQTHANYVVYQIINFMHKGDIEHALFYIEEERDILSKEERDFFIELLKSMKHEDFDKVNKILEPGRQAIETGQYDKLKELIPIEREEFQLLLSISPIKIDILSINSQGKPFDNLELKAGAPIIVRVRVMCSSVPTRCKSILQLHHWSMESKLEIIGTESKTDTLTYLKEIEFTFNTTELRQIVKEPALLRIIVEAQNILNKTTDGATINVLPDYEVHLGGINELVEKAREISGRKLRKRFPIE